jgi:hypothetical protein
VDDISGFVQASSFQAALPASMRRSESAYINPFFATNVLYVEEETELPERPMDDQPNRRRGTIDTNASDMREYSRDVGIIRI